MNAGPLAISNAFLGDRESYDHHDIARLETSMITFINLCGSLLKLNNQLIGSDQVAIPAVTVPL